MSGPREYSLRIYKAGVAAAGTLAGPPGLTHVTGQSQCESEGRMGGGRLKKNPVTKQQKLSACLCSDAFNQTPLT